jgi:cytochrome c peroxidase
VLDFYDDVDSRRGNDRNPNVSRDELDPLLRQLRGVDDDDDDDDLLSFLRALSDASFDRTTPRRVPSGLAVGGRIRYDPPPHPWRCQWLEVAPCPLSTR